jgi:hypothetical protein
MDHSSVAALQHIRQMESRIARQTELIVALRRSGEDTLEATRKLALLHGALEEMQIQLGGLLPTEARERLKLAR